MLLVCFINVLGNVQDMFAFILALNKMSMLANKKCTVYIEWM